MKANESQVGGEHYKAKAIQPWDYITSNNLGYLEGNIIKYVSRWKDKGGIQDLEKARHYLDKLIEIQSAESNAGAANADGWIEWKGGDCPVPYGTMIEVRFRRGNVEGPIKALDIDAGASPAFWQHDGISSDIIAYKVVE
jgi:hypothetical protein